MDTGLSAATGPSGTSRGPKTREEVVNSDWHRDLSTPKIGVGDPAVDFCLPTLPSDRTAEAGSVRLSDLLGHTPIALIFGSYTWPPFRRQLGALHDLWRAYRDRVAFFVVYIKEAHPEDGWISDGNLADGIHVYDPTSDEERAEVAHTCAVDLRIEMPVLIDEIDNRVARAYGALPDRLYLVGRDGRIAYQGGRGPQGFKAEELAEAIRDELQATGS